jgi:hypothetical protein
VTLALGCAEAVVVPQALLCFCRVAQSSDLTELPVPIRLCTYFDMYFTSLRMFYIASKLLVILSQNANVDVWKVELGF